jgi:hypothetical protein
MIIGCAGSVPYSGAQPGALAPGASQTLTIDDTVRRRILVGRKALMRRRDASSVGRPHLRPERRMRFQRRKLHRDGV